MCVQTLLPPHCDMIHLHSAIESESIVRCQNDLRIPDLQVLSLLLLWIQKIFFT
jgi:hypothetical protein